MFQISPEHISFIFVFIEGILSFFSPCVIPLIPIYASYLAGHTRGMQDDQPAAYQTKTVLFHTIWFILGISTAFFVLGLSLTAIGHFFSQYQGLIARIGGIIVVILGLIQLGIFRLPFLDRDHRLGGKVLPANMNGWVAYVMGFTFSFAWTPCVGPALSSVLLLATSAQSPMLSGLLLLTYTLGFILPFLALGLFTQQVLNFIAAKKHLLPYAIKAGGVILIVMGISMYTGFWSNTTNYLNNPQAPEPPAASVQRPAFDFTLTDQYGNSHTLSDYQGKVVFLNFWATWCGPCRIEMPHIEQLYQEYGFNENDVVFLSVIIPNGSPQELDQEGIQSFLIDEGYTYPVLFDQTGDVFADYGVNSYPTTFMIDKNGERFGYVTGSLTKNIMINIIDQTLDSTN